MGGKTTMIGLAGVLLGVLLSSATVVLAGTLGSPAAPGDTSSYTLADIYNRLNTGADGSRSTFTEPAAGPGTATMHTLDEIMLHAPAAKNFNGATPAQVLSGKTFWGLNTDLGAWGPQTGSMADRDGDNASTAQARSGGNSYFTAPEGYYDGDDRISATDAQVRALDTGIAASNIKQGVDIFGEAGTLTPDGGTADAAALFDGRTAHLTGDWVLDTGTLTLACKTAVFDGTANKVPNAFDGDGTGNNRWCMTASGNATADDISVGIKAWVDGVEVTGNLHGGCTCCSTCTLRESRWCDNGDGTVTDLTTCLVWLQDAGWGDQRTWSNAHIRAGTLAAADYAWLSDGSVVGDWRLPTQTELDDLLNGNPQIRCGSASCNKYGFVDIAGLTTTPGGDTIRYGYWSSTSNPSSTGYAYRILPSNGNWQSTDKSDSYTFVWPVRIQQ